MNCSAQAYDVSLTCPKTWTDGQQVILTCRINASRWTEEICALGTDAAEFKFSMNGLPESPECAVRNFRYTVQVLFFLSLFLFIFFKEPETFLECAIGIQGVEVWKVFLVCDFFFIFLLSFFLFFFCLFLFSFLSLFQLILFSFSVQ